MVASLEAIRDSKGEASYRGELASAMVDAEARELRGGLRLQDLADHIP